MPILRTLASRALRGQPCATRNIARHFSAKPGCVQGEIIWKPLDLTKARVGQNISNPYETTMSTTHTQSWQSVFFQHDRLYSSLPYAESIQLKDTVLPYTMMLFQTTSMSHIDVYADMLEIGFENATYVRPVYDGDTVRRSFTIKGVKSANNNKDTILTVKCELFNQRKQLCFSVDKLMLFPHTASPQQLSRSPLNPKPSEASHLRSHILEERDSLPASQSSKKLREGQLILHTYQRPIGNSANMALGTTFRLTHPLHYNLNRHSPEDLVVPGGLALSMVVAISSRGFYEVLHESIEHCSFQNKVNPEETISAISFVHSAEAMDDRSGGGGLEELQVTTVGFKNLDTDDLVGVDIPLALFEKQMKPATLEKLLEAECPQLCGKVVVRAERKILRQRPFSHHQSMALL